MFCEMSQDNTVCECKHEKKQRNDGVNLTKEKSACCSSEITELTNSNLLSTVKIEHLYNISSFGSMIIDLSPGLEIYAGSSLKITADKTHLPKLDIPLLNSSLLI